MDRYIYEYKKIAEDMYEIFFTATNITYENDRIYIIGDVGYQGDEKTIRLIYHISQNEIIIDSDYRLLHCEKDEYIGTYKMIVTNPSCKLLKLDNDQLTFNDGSSFNTKLLAK